MLTGNDDGDGADHCRTLKETHKADVLVSLLEEHEYKSLKIDSLFDVCKREGIDVLHLPIAGKPTIMHELILKHAVTHLFEKMVQRPTWRPCRIS